MDAETPLMLDLSVEKNSKNKVLPILSHQQGSPAIVEQVSLCTTFTHGCGQL